MSIFTTIALRGAISALDFTRDSGDGNSPIVQALNVVQIVAIGMSLLTNVSSTVIVGFYVWYASINHIRSIQSSSSISTV